jgi:hypothetical protein
MTFNVAADYFVSRNYVESNFLRPPVLINGNFSNWQRYESLTEVDLAAFGGYTADRWMLTLPAGQTATISKQTSFVTSNSLSESCWGLALTNATASLPASSQFVFQQRIEGIVANQLLYRPVVFSGKVQTNKAGIYSAFIAWTDTVNTKTIYSVVPITLNGTGLEETFKASFQPCPSNFTPVLNSNLSVTIGIVLAGNLTNVTNLYLNVNQGTEAYCATGQVNLFDTASNYIKFSQLVLNAGTEAQPFIVNTKQQDDIQCRRYFERKTLCAKTVSLFAGTSTHFGNVDFANKRAVPTLSFSNLDVTKTSIATSADVYYAGGNTPLVQPSFAAAVRTTQSSSGFTFSTSSSTPAGIDSGYINQDLLINAEL